MEEIFGFLKLSFLSAVTARNILFSYLADHDDFNRPNETGDNNAMSTVRYADSLTNYILNCVNSSPLPLNQRGGKFLLKYFLVRSG